MNFSEALSKIRQLKTDLQRSDQSDWERTRTEEEYHAYLYALLQCPVMTGVQGDRAFLVVNGDRYEVPLSALWSIAQRGSYPRLSFYADEVNDTTASDVEPVTISNDSSDADGLDESMENVEDVTDEVPSSSSSVRAEQNIHCMDKDEFTFSYHTVLIYDADDREVYGGEIICVPLYLDVPEPVLFIWASDGTGVFTGVSDPVRKEVLVPLGGYKFLVRGRMEDGQLITQLRLTKAETEAGYRLESTFYTRGTSSHLYMAEDGMRVHVCPITFKNNSFGNADFVYCVEHKDGSYECGTNTEPQTWIGNGKSRRQLLSKWDGDSLYGILRG